MTRVRTWLLLALISLPFAQPVHAQAARFDGEALQRMCGQGVCTPALVTVIDRLQKQNLPPDDFNSQLGAIAAVLFQIANGADAATTQQLVEAFRLLALFSTDAAQRDSFVLLAGQISGGAGDLFDLDTPFAVSPS